MFERKMEEEGHICTNADKSQEHEKGSFVCPVCRKFLHADSLVDMKSIVEDNLYGTGGVLIVNSRVELHCNFEHRYEKGFTLDEPHKLMAVVDAAFDRSGACIHFEIVDILPG